MLHALKAQLTEAERTLNLPATPDTAQARYRLILWSEMARGTLKHLETQSRQGGARDALETEA
jgi:hypothetical protein